MKLIITDSYEQSCEKATEIICALLQQKPTAKLGLATGSTPVPIYARLIEKNKAGDIDFSAVRTVNLDEYEGIQPDHPQSYRYFMNENLFDHININKENTFVAAGKGSAEQNAALLDEKVFEGGVTDLQLLGIGNNGHIGFNEASDYLIAPSHIEVLTKSTIQANARFFASAGEVPTKAITMGMKGILAASKILLVATGASKKEAMQGLLCDDKVTPQNPATFVKLHADATVIIDRELAEMVGVSPK